MQVERAAASAGESGGKYGIGHTKNVGGSGFKRNSQPPMSG